MQEKNSADTALRLLIAALFVTWLVTLFWVARHAPGWRTTHFLVLFIAVSAVGFVLEARADRRMDEVELAAARFGSRWGLVCGVLFMAVLTVLPPVQALLAETFDDLGRIQDRTMTGESRLFLLGIMSTFMAQMLFRSILSAGWKWSKR